MTAEQKAQLEAKYKIIADLQQRINALEAQKGIQTLQTSQPQSAQPNSAVFTNTGTTPQDNYFSWQYEVNQRKAQEKAQQDSTPKESYLSAQWEINQRKAQEQAEQQPTQPQESYWSAQYARQQQAQDYPDYPKTGIPPIDRKIAQKIPLSALDISDVKRITGLDLQKYSADLNVKKTDLTQGIRKMNSAFSAIESTLDLMNETEKSAGRINTINRGLHNTFGGLVPLTDENQYYRGRDIANTRKIANALSDGKTTDQDKQDAKDIYQTNLRGSEAQLHTLNSAYKDIVLALDEGLRNIKNAGGKITKEQYNAREKAYNVFDYLRAVEKGNDKFSYDKLKELTKDYREAYEMLLGYGDI